MLQDEEMNVFGAFINSSIDVFISFSVLLYIIFDVFAPVFIALVAQSNATFPPSYNTYIFVL